MPTCKSEEISVAVRKKVVEAYKIEKSLVELARLFGITRTTINNIIFKN
jgi:plasmid maintenance system antidote protein VapI